ncbi:Hpt domain-containing protein [Massilia sp. CF038]|uniref:Hpt domain-containing protein n=1 Tax=Massilia sp. CF038 TaxID=1881045 RepID=UPI00091A9814|nr:Hpt domain-containing protein [Massilia sp. CF038]SHH68173.1 two-component system, unclassified family, sensor histidine kinase and response regulator [Massilia sp. CF038]
MTEKTTTSPDKIELRADPVTRDIVDVADGIERLMGNRDLYARMLRRFRREYQDSTLPIRTALAAHDKNLAHRLVHSLKGAAGMIGAHRLQERASQLEQAIRTDSDDQRELLASLTPEFQRVLLLLDVLLEGSPPPGMPVQVPSRPLMEDAALLSHLMELLSHGDGAAIDLLEESSASLRVILGDAALQRVSEAIHEFDFDEALEVLGETSGGSGI